MRFHCSRCKRPISEERGFCSSCLEIRLQEKIDKQVNRKLSKLKNTIYYGISRVKNVADGKFWASSHKNDFRCSIGTSEKKPESMQHILAKFIRYIHHRQLGRVVFTELIMKNNKRADLIIVEGGFVWVEEICVSEKEKSIIQKKKDYPFPIQVIKAKDLNIEEFIKNAI